MVNQKKVEQVLAAVKKQFTVWVDEEKGYAPKVIEQRGGNPAICWESGAPYQWALLVNYGGVDEEFGFGVEAAELPAGVEVEAYNGYVLNIYAT
jgi:hypothetical protein